MPYNYLILKILLVIYTFYIKQIQCNELCWNNDEECTIKTELFKNLELSHGITMQIDCHFNLKENNAQDHLQQTEEENDFQTSTKNRFMGIQTVMLDGCQTPLNALTYGLEFLPICKYITKVSIRHFHMDILRPLHCQAENSQQLQLEYLNIQFNEIAAIEADSFVANTPQLRDVLIEKNSLKLIHKDAFKAIRSLENLYIVNEPVLMLKFPDLFEYTSVASVHLEALKQMTSGIFKHLPETLQNLYVANTPFDNVALLLRNSLVLRNLTIKHCALEKFTLHDVHSTVKRIDLSGNVMKTFTAYENKLNELNLSNNQLQWLPFEWLANLSNLECLILTGNHIKFLHLDNLLKSLPNVSLFDLSQNQLQSLQGYDNVIPDVVLSQVRIKCDQNPWDCLWLHEFAHYQPEKFRILQYEKFISKINVNGLQCIPSEKIPTTPAITTNNATQRENTAITPDHFLNVSTYTLVYGSPWEFKRNQRAEALIIVFMLPLGIAFLFLLLYMWIYCQKMFHLSYYKGFSCMQTPANHPSQRFDVVRQLPLPTLQTETRRPLTQIVDGTEMAYEVPINGIVSECNCIALHSDDTPTAKCEKSVHITYEQLPTEEPPSQIYEEII